MPTTFRYRIFQWITLSLARSFTSAQFDSFSRCVCEYFLKSNKLFFSHVNLKLLFFFLLLMWFLLSSPQRWFHCMSMWVYVCAFFHSYLSRWCQIVIIVYFLDRDRFVRWHVCCYPNALFQVWQCATISKNFRFEMLLLYSYTLYIYFIWLSLPISRL